MPISLQDPGIKKVYDSLPRGKTLSLKNAGVRKLLSEIGDRSNLSATSTEEQLKNAVSPVERIKIVQEGADALERADLKKIIEDGDVRFSKATQKFLGQVAGITPVNPTTGNIAISSVTKVAGGVKISGTTEKNQTIEVINLSRIVRYRLHDDNTHVLGNSDAQGNFSGVIKASAGEYLRMRTRDANGKTGEWISKRVDELGADTENAELADKRIELSVIAGGKIAIANNNNSRPISEPYATLRFTNAAGKSFDVKLDDTGRFVGVPKIDGKPGEKMSVAVSDGRHNTDFKKVAATLLVPGGGGSVGFDFPDPLPHKDDVGTDGKSRYAKVRFTGAMWGSGGPDFQEVMQGNIGNCFAPSAVSKLAHTPKLWTSSAEPPGRAALINLFKDAEKRGKDAGHPAGTLIFAFYDANGKQVETNPVDGDLYVRSNGEPLYGACTNSTDPQKMHLWWPLFEKAYADFRDLTGPKSYDSIGNGGASCDVFEAVMNLPGDQYNFGTSNKDRIFTKMQEQLRKGLPVCMGTKDDHSGGAFANSGVYGDHSYSVLDVYEKNGVKYVELRNPWGESEPDGNGKNDGIFVLKLDDMPKWYDNMSTVAAS